MSQQVSYTSHGPNTSPFTSDEAVFLFSDAQLQQRSDLLRHLAQYGTQLTLVKGESGSGKSTLLRNLEDHSHPSWRVFSIAGNPLLTEDQVLIEIAKGCDLSTTNIPAPDIWEQLEKRLGALGASGLNPVVIVDDAQVIPQETLAALVRISAMTGLTGQSCRVILAADLSIEFMLSALPANTVTAEPTRIEIMPLDLEQTAAYLTHRFNAAGWTGELPFGKSEIVDIFEKSRGIPEKINLYGQDLFSSLNARAGLTESSNNKGTNKGGRFLKIAGITAIVFIAILTLSFQDQINKVFESNPKSTSRQGESIPLKMPPQHTTPRATAKGPQIAATAKRAVIANREQKTPAEPKRPVIAKAEHEPAPLKPSAPAASSAQGPRVALNPGKPPSPKPAAQLTRDERWLLDQKPNVYSLQLLAAGSEDAVQKFAAKYRLGSRGVYFRSLRDNKDWFTLLYGMYPDRSSARNAISDLPIALRNAKPWARSLETVHKAINER